jgi:hypothetical protein
MGEESNKMIFFIVMSIGVFWLLFIKKELRPVVYLVCIVPLCLAVFNIDNPDKDNYIALYERIGNNGMKGITLQTEFGIQILMMVAQWFHIGAELFFDFFYLIAFALLIRFAEKWSDKPAVVLGMYCIYPLFLDIVQIRSMMATMIFLNAIGYLKCFNWKNCFKYLGCVFLAFSIHYSAIFFLVFLLAYLPTKKIVMLITVAMAALFMVENNFIYERILSFIPFIERQLLRYRNNSISTPSFFSLVIIFAFNISVVVASLNYAKKRKLLEQKNAVMILKVNVISALLLIVSVNNLEFMRLYRPIEILNYSVMGGLASYNRRTHKYRIKPIFYAMLIMASGWMLWYRFIMIDHYTDVIECILQQNLLFK